MITYQIYGMTILMKLNLEPIIYQYVIEFHNQYKYKVSSSYEDDYLDALIGLWCFRLNVEGETASNIFRDENDSNNYSILIYLWNI